MSQGNYSEEIKEHILSEHEAGVSVRELARQIRALGDDDSKLETSSQGEGE